MKTMSASEFKTRCLKVMDKVQAMRETIIITKRGGPVAKLVPVEKRYKKLFGCLVGKVKIIGDIESPIVPPQTWQAFR